MSEDWRRREATEHIESAVIDDLLTIIDFCDAMARGLCTPVPDPYATVYAIQEANDITHVLAGGRAVMGWGSVRWAVNRLEEGTKWFGPAWPDVRERMVDVLARAEEMTR